MHDLCKSQCMSCSRCTFEFVCHWSDDLARLQGQEQGQEQEHEQEQEQEEGELKVC